ncbi:MAG: hypothetical protein HY286_10570 [Planctomycetes bacterium]|nr:hypothetical protein [Planctomycetota bacterium]
MQQNFSVNGKVVDVVPGPPGVTTTTTPLAARTPTATSIVALPCDLQKTFDIVEDFGTNTNEDAFPGNSQNTSVPITVTDGVFQFSTLQILNPTNTLRFDGPGAPARIYVRGKVNIQGTLDVGGNPGSRSASNSDKATFAGINISCMLKNTLEGSAISGWAGGSTGCALFPQYPVGKPGGRGGPLGGDGGHGGDLAINIPGQTSVTAAGFQSFDGANGIDASLFPGSLGTVATGGAGTPAVPVFNVSGQILYALNSLTVPAPYGFGSGVNYDGCVAVGCNGSGNSVCDGIFPQATGTTPNFYSIQMGAPAGGGASYFEDGTVGTWCQESAVTATCGISGANKKTVPLWTTVSGTIPSNPPASNVFPYYPSPPTGTGGVEGIFGAEPTQFGSDGVGNFSMLRPGAGGDGGDHMDHPNCTALPACQLSLDNFTAGKLWGQSMAPCGAGGGGAVLIQSNGAISLAPASVSVNGGIGGDGRLPSAANATTAAKAFLSKFIFPGIATNIPFRLRGGDGGNGRWHYQSSANTNLDAAFTPAVQTSSHSSPYTGINIAAADFSGAESGWFAIPPGSGSFIKLIGYDLFIQTTGGPATLRQDDVSLNQVLTQSFAAGGTLPVRVLFQGTQADTFGQPDPAARTPWTDQVTTLTEANPKFVRFVVVFSRATSVANPAFIGIDKIAIRGKTRC